MASALQALGIPVEEVPGQISAPVVLAVSVAVLFVSFVWIVVLNRAHGIGFWSFTARSLLSLFASVVVSPLVFAVIESVAAIEILGGVDRYQDVEAKDR